MKKWLALFGKVALYQVTTPLLFLTIPFKGPLFGGVLAAIAFVIKILLEILSRQQISWWLFTLILLLIASNALQLVLWCRGK